jgi:hypothetical protein
MRTGDCLRDLAERGIGFSCVFKTVLRHDDRVRPAPSLVVGKGRKKVIFDV